MQIYHQKSWGNMFMSSIRKDIVAKDLLLCGIWPVVLWLFGCWRRYYTSRVACQCGDGFTVKFPVDATFLIKGEC